MYVCDSGDFKSVCINIENNLLNPFGIRDLVVTEKYNSSIFQKYFLTKEKYSFQKIH